MSTLAQAYHPAHLLCKQCGGPHEKDDHHCPWCRTEFDTGAVDDDEYDDWEEFAEEMHRQMDEEDQQERRDRDLYSFGWTDARSVYGTVHIEPYVPKAKEINWGAVLIGAALGIWALYVTFGW